MTSDAAEATLIFPTTRLELIRVAFREAALRETGREDTMLLDLPAPARRYEEVGTVPMPRPKRKEVPRKVSGTETVAVSDGRSSPSTSSRTREAPGHAPDESETISAQDGRSRGPADPKSPPPSPVARARSSRATAVEDFPHRYLDMLNYTVELQWEVGRGRKGAGEGLGPKWNGADSEGEGRKKERRGGCADDDDGDRGCGPLANRIPRIPHRASTCVRIVAGTPPPLAPSISLSSSPASSPRVEGCGRYDASRCALRFPPGSSLAALLCPGEGERFRAGARESLGPTDRPGMESEAKGMAALGLESQAGSESDCVENADAEATSMQSSSRPTQRKGGEAEADFSPASTLTASSAMLGTDAQPITRAKPETAAASDANVETDDGAQAWIRGAKARLSQRQIPVCVRPGVATIELAEEDCVQEVGPVVAYWVVPCPSAEGMDARGSRGGGAGQEEDEDGDDSQAEMRWNSEGHRHSDGFRAVKSTTRMAVAMPNAGEVLVETKVVLRVGTFSKAPEGW